jgi:3',5'-cyclic AMP phosphodiesterase CpdA
MVYLRATAYGVLIAGILWATDACEPHSRITGTPSDTTTHLPPPPPQVLVGAGDIASCKSEWDEMTAALLDSIPGTIFTLGDNAYDNGTPQDYADCYHPSWGRFLSRTRPVPGNHDYSTAAAAGYFGYFGARAGDPARGYYSYDLGAWHVVVLNTSNASIVDISAESPQVAWLRKDLAASNKRCTVAMFHHPRFSSGTNGNHWRTAPLWDALYEAGVEIVLVGHDHIYERFAPQTPSGFPDPRYGIRQFVVGTGGSSNYEFVAIQPNSEVRERLNPGVLKLTLKADTYEWQFIPVAGGTLHDSGTGACHDPYPYLKTTH